MNCRQSCNHSVNSMLKKGIMQRRSADTDILQAWLIVTIDTEQFRWPSGWQVAERSDGRGNSARPYF